MQANTGNVSIFPPRTLTWPLSVGSTQPSPTSLTGPGQQPDQGCSSPPQDPSPLTSFSPVPELPCTEAPEWLRGPHGVGKWGTVACRHCRTLPAPTNCISSASCHALILWHSQKVDKLSHMCLPMGVYYRESLIKQLEMSGLWSWAAKAGNKTVIFFYFYIYVPCL